MRLIVDGRGSMNELVSVAKAHRVRSWLGLTPSRQQSGESDRQGSITKTGSVLVRRLLVEFAGEPRETEGLVRDSGINGLGNLEQFTDRHVFERMLKDPDKDVAWRARDILERRFPAKPGPEHVAPVSGG